MSISASLVKELRERTGAGMMECKKALVECHGDIDIAIENMRKKGMAQADKKAGRIAADGRIGVAVSDCASMAAIVEVNSETDFVAKGDDFIGFTNAVAQLALTEKIQNVDALLAAQLENQTVEDKRRALIAKLGENINVRRVHFVSSDCIGQYSHGSKIGVLVALDGGDSELGKDIAMHIAASNPQAIDDSGVDASLLEKEKALFTEQAIQSGKPEAIVEKMVAGRITKFLKEITLVNQPFVKDPDTTVSQLLKQKDAKVIQFLRYEVGEGIEKKSDNFAEEVAAQVAAAEK